MDGKQTEGNERPNIVLIMSDQHNPKVMGCASDPIVQTPNFDALAGEGVSFTNTYCPYPLCVPSRAAFMAGEYPSDIGVYENGGVFSSHVPTFAHSLGAAGYEAVLCGRMHFVGPDQFHGFEKRIHGDSGGAVSKEIIGSGYNRTNGQTKYAVQVSGHGRAGYEAYDRSVTDSACAFISAPRDDERPYCLVVGTILPHNPLICSKDLFDGYMAQIAPPEPVSEAYLSGLHPAMRKWRERRGVEDLTPEQRRRGLAAYYGLVTELDRCIGRIVDAVRSSPEGERTVIIYCSDHGDMAGEHGMWWKSSFYDGSARIPLIVSWPGQFSEGAERSANVSLIDVGPTVLEIAGAEPLPGVSGRSFAELLKAGGADAGGDREVYSEYIGLLGDLPACMIRTGPWKLNYYHEFDSCQLFNMEEDPQELHDRAGDPECREIVAACLAKINRRWSAEAMLENAEKQRQARSLIGRCGHGLMPHPAPQFTPPEDANQFDFSQLPGGRPQVDDVEGN